MFEDVFGNLSKGQLLKDLSAVQKQFDIAVIKKMGVLKLPYHFWSSDVKINPSTEHLVWAAFLLEDSDRYVQVEAIVAQEVAGQLNVNNSNSQLLDSSVSQRLQEIAVKFLAHAPNDEFRHTLLAKVGRCAPSLLQSNQP